MYNSQDEEVHNAISRMEIVRSDKQLLGEPRIKKDKISIAQLQQYLVNMVDAGNRDNAKAEPKQQFETEVFKWSHCSESQLRC